MSFATDFATRLGPLLDYDPDGVGEALCAAGENMFGGLDAIVQDSDDGPGWSIVLDPALTPALWLPWTGALYGVRVTIGAEVEAQREEVTDLAPQKRGTTESMVVALKRTLTGNKSVLVAERHLGEAYFIHFISSPSETPDPDASLAALLSQKPGGLILTYAITDSPTWNDTILVWNAVAAGVTWDNAETGDV